MSQILTKTLQILHCEWYVSGCKFIIELTVETPKGWSPSQKVELFVGGTKVTGSDFRLVYEGYPYIIFDDSTKLVLPTKLQAEIEEWCAKYWNKMIKF